jgi:hypothetical protein
MKNAYSIFPAFAMVAGMKLDVFSCKPTGSCSYNQKNYYG